MDHIRRSGNGVAGLPPRRACDGPPSTSSSTRKMLLRLSSKMTSKSSTVRMDLLVAISLLIDEKLVPFRA